MNTPTILNPSECQDRAALLRREALEILAAHRAGGGEWDDPAEALSAIGWRLQTAEEWEELAAQIRAAK